MGPREKKRQIDLAKKKNVRLHSVSEEVSYDYNYLITLEYDGYKLGGYAKQKHGNTVQNKLEDALNTILGQTVKTVESSRTDAKVHAKDQKVMFKFYKQLNLSKIKESLNNMIDNDINILKVENVDKEFHCRYDVSSKTYCYYITKDYSVFNRNYKYFHNRKLNVSAMKKCCNYLVGEHDFTSFCSTKATQDSKVRTINYLNIEETPTDVIIKINGSGFLYNMVRIIVGTLLEVSDGSIKVSDVKNILESQDRKKAGATAPAHGLYLEEIKY